MKNAILNHEAGQDHSSEVLKATALLYFQEALVREQYESCKELLDSARSYGAQSSEIKSVIAAHIRDKAGGNEASRKKKGLRY